MTEQELPEPKLDKQGRVLDKQGRPLRDRRNRNYGNAPFMGKDGKDHPRKKRLEARQAAFDALKLDPSRRRPGSTKK